MKIGLSITIIGKGIEFSWGKDFAELALIEISGTILTVGISFFIKV